MKLLRENYCVMVLLLQLNSFLSICFSSETGYQGNTKKHLGYDW